MCSRHSQPVSTTYNSKFSSEMQPFLMSHCNMQWPLCLTNARLQRWWRKSPENYHFQISMLRANLPRSQKCVCVCVCVHVNELHLFKTLQVFVLQYKLDCSAVVSCVCKLIFSGTFWLQLCTKLYFRPVTKWRPNKWQPGESDRSSKEHVSDRTGQPYHCYQGQRCSHQSRTAHKKITKCSM